MNTFFRFFYEFISIFIEGLTILFNGIVGGFAKILDYKNYLKILNEYKDSFQGPEWVFVMMTIGVLVIIVLIIAALVYLYVKKFLRNKLGKYKKEDLLDEISSLNNQVDRLMKENNEIMAMKVSQLGLKPGENPTDDVNPDDPDAENKGEDEEKQEDHIHDIRFPKLAALDEKFANYKPQNYENSFTLLELIDNFRCFSASQLHLYYDPVLLRPFFAGLACGKLIILQGISGTGKTSLAYAWGKFVNNDSCVASVEPSWKDKTEFLGYFNEFTKKFNETGALEELYAAGFDDKVHTMILDEMNIARVEYYFAEMLSILEMPSRDEWIIELVSNSWASDPKRVIDGKLKLPGNIWYIGTINNDDSTFMVTDKVYDRAMPIDINTKVDPFECREQEAMDINSSYLEAQFKEAQETYKISKKSLELVKVMDDYVITHFRVAFGNRIMKQMNSFVPVYVACGGAELAGIDYFIAKKIFRKFEQLNISFIRDEIDPFINYLNKTFGQGVMVECISYLELIKKSL